MNCLFLDSKHEINTSDYAFLSKYYVSYVNDILIVYDI